MVRKAASSLLQFISEPLALMISKTCLRVTLPTFSLFGTLDPEAIPAAFLSSTMFVSWRMSSASAGFQTSEKM